MRSRTSSKERRQARIERAEAALARTPVPRTYRYPDGELRVLEVPARDSSGWLEVQRCFLWKDHDGRVASLSCTPTNDIGLPPDRLDPRD